MPITPQPTTARALVQTHLDNRSEPLVCWLAITRFPSPLSEAGFP